MHRICDPNGRWIGSPLGRRKTGLSSPPTLWAIGTLPDFMLLHKEDRITAVIDVTDLFSGPVTTLTILGYAGAQLDGYTLIIDPIAVTTGAIVTLRAMNEDDQADITFEIVVQPLAFVELTLSGSGQIGDAHTVAAALTHADATVSFEWWDGQALIAGAYQDVFVPEIDQDQTDIFVRVTATKNGVTLTQDTNAISITHAPPIPFGALSDLSLGVNNAMTPVSIADRFLGEAMTYTLSPLSDVLPDGLLFTSDGVLSGTPRVPVSLAALVFEATNSGGSANQNLRLVVTEAVDLPTISILSTGEQSGEDIPVFYTASANITCDVLVYPALTAPPLVAYFDQETTGYTQLGQIELATQGLDIALELPDGLNGTYRIALLPAGGQDVDIVISGDVALDTRISSGAAYMLAVGDTGINSLEDQKTLVFDMAAHNGVDDVLVLMSIYHRLANRTPVSASLDGQLAQTVFKQTGVNGDHTVLGYAIIPGASFAMLSDFVLTMNGAIWRLNAAAFSILRDSTVNVIANLPETLRTGSDLGGDITLGAAVIAAQTQRNGIDLDPTSWGDVVQVYKNDIQSDEWLHVALGADIQAGTVNVSPDGGVGVKTNGLSLEVIA